MEKDVPDDADSGVAQMVVGLEGEQAYQDGISRTACPYVDDPKLCEAWRSGWDEAEARARLLNQHGGRD